MGSTVAGTVGGNSDNQVTLTTTELPSHTHTMSHTHTIPNHCHEMSHTHEIKGNSAGGIGEPAYHYAFGDVGFRNSQTTGYYVTSGYSPYWTEDKTGLSTNSASNSTTSSVGSGTAFSILPLYLTAKYYKRVK